MGVIGHFNLRGHVMACLLCLSCSDYDGPSYVCNPVLESTLLFPSISEITQYRAPIGFGYDPLNDEY